MRRFCSLICRLSVLPRLSCSISISQDELRKYRSRADGGGAGGGGGGGPFGSRVPRPGGGKDPLTDPDIEAIVPVKEGEKARFFVLRSLNHDNLAVSYEGREVRGSYLRA